MLRDLEVEKEKLLQEIKRDLERIEEIEETLRIESEDFTGHLKRCEGDNG